MKKSVILSLAMGFALWQTAALASPLLLDNFNSYANGNLVGQGNWTITGSSVVNPIQVNNGSVALLTTGQDAYDPLSSQVALSDGQSLYIGLNLNVSAARNRGLFSSF